MKKIIAFVVLAFIAAGTAVATMTPQQVVASATPNC
jgi:hypothetical protein